MAVAGVKAMIKKTYVHLEDSETAIYHVASRIYSAYLLSMETTDRTNHEALMRQAVEAAIKMANITDELVISDRERR